MFCKNCGKEINETDAFCQYCGSKVEKEEAKAEEVKVEAEPVFEAAAPEKPEPKKPWCVFAKVGKILGIVAIATCWIPMFAIAPGIPAVVFGILGKKSPDEESKASAKKGFGLGLAGSIVSVVVYIIVIIVAAVIAAIAAATNA